MKPSTAWLSSSALLITLAIQSAPLSTAPLPPQPKKHFKQQPKGAQVTQQRALSSLLITLPKQLKTNLLKLGFYSGLDYNTNHTVNIQSTSDLKRLPFTNVLSLPMNDSSNEVQFSSTNVQRFYRLEWNSKASIAPNLFYSITNH